MTTTSRSDELRPIYRRQARRYRKRNQDGAVVANIKRKQQAADEMYAQMSADTFDANARIGTRREEEYQRLQRIKARRGAVVFGGGMTQTKTQSAVESVENVAIGYGVSLAANA